MDFKHKAGLRAAYYLLAGCGLTLQAWLEYRHAHPVIMTLIASVGLLLLGNGLYLLLNRDGRQATLLPPLTLLLLGAFSVLDSWPDHQQGPWIYLFPLYLFSLLRFRIALPCALLYSTLISVMLFSHHKGVELYQMLFLHWITSAVTALFTFINLSKKRQLGKLQIVDPATTAFNFSQLPVDLKREISRARREKSGLALLLLTPTQPVASEDLRTLARQLQSWLRPFDRLYRYQAQQLAILLPDKTNLKAQRMANRLCLSSPLLKAPDSTWVRDCLLLEADENAAQLLARASHASRAPGRHDPLGTQLAGEAVSHV